jgi:hypothetical protein
MTYITLVKRGFSWAARRMQHPTLRSESERAGHAPKI